MAIEEILKIHDQATPTLKMTELEARKAADRLRDLDDAARGADEWANSLRRGGQGAADASEAIGKFGSNTMKTAGALDLLDPRLGAAARGLGDAADLAEVMAGTLGGPATLAIGVVTAALIPLIGQVVVWSREADEAANRSKFLADHMYDLRDASRALEDAQLDLAVATGKVTEAEQHQQEIRDKATRAVEDFQSAQAGERKAAEDSYFAAGRVLERLDYLPDVLATAIDHYWGYTSAQQEALWTLDQLDATELQHQDTIVETAKKEGEAAAATDKAKEAKQRSTAASKEAATAERDLAQALAKVRAEQAAREAADKGLQAIILASASAEEKARAAYRARNEEIQAAIDLGASEADVLAAKSASLQQLTKDLDAAAESQRRLNTATTEGGQNGPDRTAAGLSTVAGGPSSVMGAVSSSGPWGSIIASLVSIAGDFKGLGDEFNDFTINFNESMAQLPDLLTENLGRWISTGTASVIEMMFANIDAMVDPGMWYGVGESIVEGFISGFTTGRFVGDNGKVTGKSVGMGLLDVFSGGLSGNIDEFSRTGKLGSFDTGTSYVPRTGLYMLHEGEAVDNMQGGGGSQSQRERRSGRASVGGDGRRILLTAEIDLDGYAATIQDARRRGYGV